MNTDYYRILLKVIETGNISKAAEQLGYTQSGVSNVIGKIEKQFEMKLFQRNRNGIELVEEASSLVPYIEGIVREEEGLMHEISRKVKAAEIDLRIIAMHSFAVTLLPQLLHDFQKEHPNVHFHVKEIIDYDLIEKAIIDREAEFAFTVFSDNPQIEFKELFRDDYYIVMPKDHPLAEYDVVEPEQIAEYPFIIPEEGIFHKSIKDLIASMKVNRNLATKTIDDMMILSLVEKGWGISVVPRQLTKLSNHDISLARLQGDFHRYVGIIRKNEKISRHHKVFYDFVENWFSGITF